MTATVVTAIFLYEKNYYEQINDFLRSLYIKNFCTEGKIGIGVILYEKGKGKFVGDWKNPPYRNYKQTKGNSCSEVKR